MSNDVASEFRGKPAPVRDNCWKFVADVDALQHDVTAALFRANRPSTFGVDSVRGGANSRTAWGAVFVGPRNRRIGLSSFWAMEWFFTRDGEEANVFEYDPIFDRFVRLTLDDIKTRWNNERHA